MNVVDLALRRIAADLERRSQFWAIVGGFAVSARSEPRFTRDVDVAVAVADDSAAEQLVRDLLSDGYGLLASVEHDEMNRLATARLTMTPSPSQQSIVVDLLFASSGVEPEIVANAERLEILPDLAVPVARTGHLIAVKLLARDDARRPQDLADLRALLSVATPTDLEIARTTVDVITERGFHRGRDLRQALEEFLPTE